MIMLPTHTRWLKIALKENAFARNMFHMVAECGDGPRRVRNRGDRGREGRGVDRNREDREHSRGGLRDDKTKGDDNRHLAESATRDAKHKAAKDACVANAEASKMQIIEHVVEVPQIEYQEVVRHVTVPQVVTQEVVRQVPVPQNFVQMGTASGSDRSNIPSFLSEGTSHGGRYGPQSGEIVGILKQLLDETSVDLQTLEKEELDQKTNHQSLVKAKIREILAVEVEKMESEPFEAERAPFVKMKGLITRLINRLQTEISHVSYCDEETSMAAEKKEDLEADIAKHSSTLETAVSRFTKADPESTNEGHPDKICDQITDVVIDACLTRDAKCKVASETCVKDNMFMVAGEITVAEKMDHKTVVRGVMPSIEFDSFIDDLSSVGGKGLKHQLEMDTMCADERDDQVGTDSFELDTAVSRFGVLNGDITQQQQQHKHNNFHSKQRQQSGQTEEEEKEERERRKGEREKEEERDADEEAREQVKKACR